MDINTKIGVLKLSQPQALLLTNIIVFNEGRFSAGCTYDILKRHFPGGTKEMMWCLDGLSKQGLIQHEKFDVIIPTPLCLRTYCVKFQLKQSKKGGQLKFTPTLVNK